MFKIKDFVVYKRDVCEVVEIKNIRDREYYILAPLSDQSLTISVPTSNDVLRKVITKKEADALINEIPDIEIIEEKDKLIENIYKELYSKGDLKDLVKIIKTTYLRNENRKNLKKKPGEKDTTFFKKAENSLYNELAVALGLPYDEVKKYIMSKVA